MMGRHRKTASLGLSDTNIGSDYTPDEAEFLKAMEAYQRIHERRFPTCIEVLEVLKSCGWRKVADPQPIPKYRQQEG